MKKLPKRLVGDGPCSDCGTGQNICWFTESVFWNAVIRQGDYKEPILCIPCFVLRVDKAGYNPRAWRLLPEWRWEEKPHPTLEEIKRNNHLTTPEKK